MSENEKQKERKKKERSGKGKSHAIRNLWIIFGSMVFLVILFFFLVAVGAFGTMPTFEELETHKPTSHPKSILRTESFWAPSLWKTVAMYATTTSRIICPKPSSALRTSVS